MYMYITGFLSENITREMGGTEQRERWSVGGDTKYMYINSIL